MKKKNIAKTRSRLTHNCVNTRALQTTTTLNETSDHNRINTHQDSERTVTVTLRRRRSETRKYFIHLYIKAGEIYLSSL